MAKANQAVRDAVEAIFAGSAPQEREGVATDLLAIAGVLAREPRLRSALTDPSLQVEAKRGLVEAVFGNKVRSGALEALLAIAERQRMQGRAIVGIVEETAEQALLDVADAQGSLPAVEDELFRFARLVDGTPDLRAALTDPAASGERKRTLVEDLLAGKAHAVSTAVLGHLAAQDRAREMAVLVQDLVAEAAARRGAVVAEVRSAVPLDAEQRARLTETFGRVTGKRVDLRVVIDPSVVGSLSVRIGDEVYDGTVKRQLELARERLGVA